MSAWQAYVEEKTKIDGLIAEGYFILGVTEGLDGDAVRFVRISGDYVGEMAELLLLTADARKYMGAVLIGQLRNAPVKVGPVVM
ncbi:hypothetical protein BG53_09710 [Paenibacillus darwinianus]|uniref:Uncharacterized protein n=1 Tax=Paenibacillus darwinianus TaxID=1380763 RepID=A0A9W5RYG1_9BACL|nr:hypothetical protein [Paenibacillus darwinianus]EXX85008.1 hypothetical protein BG53_09710 [Paenibacillus darwinianus]EXX86242.1 hypothetical protein CH50_07575 [Paenibacillus darwinianus]EXX86646.1 hypothetical protein BG52_05955 [Paenibacillus darwinianus]